MPTTGIGAHRRNMMTTKESPTREQVGTEGHHYRISDTARSSNARSAHNHVGSGYSVRMCNAYELEKEQRNKQEEEQT